MNDKRGFTLLELLMVIIIIGILASIALPQYMKLREKARMAEALSILGQIRGSEVRFFAEQSTYTTTMTDLDFDPTDRVGQQFYTFAVTSAALATDFVAVATRVGASPGCTALYTVRIDRDGNTCGADCQSTATTC